VLLCMQHMLGSLCLVVSCSWTPWTTQTSQPATVLRFVQGSLSELMRMLYDQACNPHKQRESNKEPDCLRAVMKVSHACSISVINAINDLTD